MAQITLIVDTDLSKTKNSIKVLKTSFIVLSRQLSKLSVNKDLTAQLNALTKYYDSVANAGARAAQQTRGTAANVETLRKGYANLINQLNTLQKQYASGTFDVARKSIEQNFEAVKKLSQAQEVNGDEVKRLSGEYKKLAADVAQFRAEGEKLKTSDPFSPKQGDSIFRLQKQYASLLNSIKSAEQYYPKGTFDGIAKGAQEAVTGLQALGQEYTTTGTLSDASQKQLNTFSEGLNRQRAAFETTKNSAQNYHGTLRDIIQGFIKFQLSASIVMNSIQLVRSAFNSLNETLVETEKVVVSIQRVLDEAVEGGEISDKLYDIAERLGQTFDNVQEIAQNFAKAGLSWQETLEATEAAVLALNVAELTATESSEGLIAVMQQFNYEASELTYVIDVLNKAADKSAVDTPALLVALQKTGSYAAAANLSLEETVGLISALSEATAASGQNIGNALKSLFSYSSKSSSLEMFASLSEEMKAIVDMYQIGNASILDVWEQLADTMGNLSDAQADLLEQWSSDSGLETELGSALGDVYDQLTGVYDTAGVYRKNYFIALMNNFEEVKEVMGEISDAQGYTAEEQAKYMDTYEAKLNSLQAQWEHLANDEQSWLSIKKGLVDMASGILTAIDAIGGLRTAVAALVTVFMSLFGGKIIQGIAKIGKGFKNLLSPVKNFQRYTQLAAEAQQAQAIATDLQTVADQKNAAVQNLKNSADASATAIQAAETAAVEANTLATEANAVATQKAAAASKAFGSALNTVLGIAGIVITVISAIVGAIQGATAEAKRAEEERRQAAIDNWAEISEESAELSKLSQKYNELSAIQNKTAAEEETYITSQERIIELLGDRAKVLGLLTEGTEEYSNKLKELTQLELESAARDAVLAQNATLDETGNGVLLNFLATQYKGGVNQYNSATLADILYYGQDNDLKQRIKEEIEKALSNLSEETLHGEDYAITAGLDFFQDLQEILLHYIPEEDWGEGATGVFEAVKQVEEEIENRINTAAEAQSLLYLVKNGVPQTYQDIDEIVNNIIDITDVGENYRDTIEAIVVDYTGFKEVVQDTNDALDDQRKTLGTMTEENIQALADKLQEIRDIEDETKEIEERRLDITEAQKELTEAEADAAEKLAEAEKDLAKAQEDVLEAEKSINDERLSLLEKQKKAEEDLADAQQDAEEARLKILERQQEVLEAQKALEEARNTRSVWVFNNETGQFEWTQNQKAIKEAEEELKNAQENEAEAKEQYEKTLQAVTEAKEELGNINETIEDSEKAIQEAIEKGFNISKEILQEQTNIAEGVRDAIQKYIEKVEAVSDAEQEIEDTKTENAETIAEAQKNLQEAIDALNEYIEDQAWDEVISALQDGKATNEEIQDILDKWKETAEKQSATDVSWYQAIVDAIEDISGVDVTLPSGTQTGQQGEQESSNTRKPTKRWKSYEDAARDGFYEIMPYESFRRRDGQVSGGERFDTYQEYLDYMNALYGGSFDEGGIANGLGYLVKKTSHPESVNDPALTAKILSPTSNAQFERYVRDMGIMFEQARTYAQAPVLQSTAGNNIVTTTNNSTYINGVKIGSDMMRKPFEEVLQMVSMVPAK